MKKFLIIIATICMLFLFGCTTQTNEVEDAEGITRGGLVGIGIYIGEE